MSRLLLTAATIVSLCCVVVSAFAPIASSVRKRQQQQRVLVPSTRLHSSSDDAELPDYEGKTIYQRTFYRLSPGSSASTPNAILLEELLRFQSDTNNPGYILPKGPRTFIFRKGTQEDEITKELYRVHLGGSDATHNGPGTMDTTIATILFLASNPELVQGDVLQLACEDGAASLLGSVGAKFAMSPIPQDPPKGEDTLDIMAHPEHEEVFPPRLRQLTLSEEYPEDLKVAYEVAKGFSKSQVNLRDVRWSTRIPGRRYDQAYRLIVGSDIDFSYPSSKELARTVANCLLPSNEFALSTIEDEKKGSSASSSSFGAMGMDLGTSDPPAAAATDPATEVDPKVPPTFAYVCPDTRETTTYLRQFLEQGFKMTVDIGYLKVNCLQFVFQTLPEDAPETDLDGEDLELKDERFRSYQVVTAVHHPEYSGEGSGEYFFPLETGAYDSGSRSTYLEPEEGGSPW